MFVSWIQIFSNIFTNHKFHISFINLNQTIPRSPRESPRVIFYQETINQARTKIILPLSVSSSNSPPCKTPLGRKTLQHTPSHPQCPSLEKLTSLSFPNLPPRHEWICEWSTHSRLVVQTPLRCHNVWIISPLVLSGTCCRWRSSYGSPRSSETQAE